MKAVTFRSFGGPEVLEYEEVPPPVRDGPDALVRVLRASVNRLDLWMREQPKDLELPHIPGSDAVGVIEELPPGVEGLSPGQEVVINPSLPCGRCRACSDNRVCEQLRIVGFHTQGSYAEMITVPSVQLFPRPTALSLEEAASLPVTFLTAWHALTECSRVGVGDIVFVSGATGGLGLAAIQVCRYLGAQPLAVARTDAQAERLAAMGAEVHVAGRSGSAGEWLRRITAGVGVDVVFETVGAAAWKTSVEVLRPHGRLVVAGDASGSIVTTDLDEVFVRQLSIIGARMGTATEFLEVLRLADSGYFHPVVDSVYPLSEARAAQEKLASGARFGKVVLAVSEPSA